MSYSTFKLAQVKRTFQLIIEEDADLFSTAAEVPVSAWLTETLQETLTLALAINTEKVRSELLIAPMLVELRKQTGRTVSFFSGVEFNVDETQGLNGVCDYIISRSPEQLFISAPMWKNLWASLHLLPGIRLHLPCHKICTAAQPAAEMRTRL